MNLKSVENKELRIGRIAAYQVAIADVEDLMKDRDVEAEINELKAEITNLKNWLMLLERAVHPKITTFENGHTASPLLAIDERISKPAKKGDVGYNLKSSEHAVVKHNEVCVIKTSVKVKIPDGYWGIITARSSAVFKHKILVLPGIIDNGYTGELMVACIALEKQVILPPGTSIAQLILHPIVTPHLEFVDKLPETERGESGFGSTGDIGE